MTPGVLVVFEGIDGGGKTTQAGLLQSACEAAGLTVRLSKEPTNGPHGRRLRESASTGRLSAEEELETFILDRREHVDGLINPALAAGEVVILDRYYFSTAAYQGIRGLDVDDILAQNEAFAPAPDLLVLIDIGAKVGLGRVKGRGDVANLFEQEADLTRCGAIFRAIERPYRLVIDGSQSIEEVQRQIWQALVEGPFAARGWSVS
ncbi:MAG: dTMP kinase [Bradymonadia bacterium]